MAAGGSPATEQGHLKSERRHENGTRRSGGRRCRSWRHDGLGADAVGPQAVPAASPAKSPAEPLVRKALAAELAGDDAARATFLADALKTDPACREARWQSGYISIEGKWLSPSAVVQRYSTPIVT